MYQGNVSQVVPPGDGVTVKATLMGQALETSRHYVLEIVTEDGEFLSVPERSDHRDGRQAGGLRPGRRRRVHATRHQGRRAGRAVHAGARRPEGGEQVVTIGSFFIDAEHKLKRLVAGFSDHRHHRARHPLPLARAAPWSRACRAQRLRAPHGGARRHSRHLRSPDHRLREVAAQPAGDRARGHRAGHPRAGRIARHPCASWDVAHGVLVRLRHPRGSGPPRRSSDSSSPIGSTRSARSCRRTPTSRSDRTPAAWAGSSSTRSSTGRASTTCASCAC